MAPKRARTMSKTTREAYQARCRSMASEQHHRPNGRDCKCVIFNEGKRNATAVYRCKTASNGKPKQLKHHAPKCKLEPAKKVLVTQRITKRGHKYVLTPKFLKHQFRPCA